MKMRHSLAYVLLALMAIVLTGCQTTSPTTMTITTTTSLLGSIASAIGKEHVTVTSIVPAGMCPGHFDITSQDIKNLVNSKVLFNHGWEKWTDKILSAVDNKPTLYTIGVTGNFMVPALHKEASIRIATVLCSLDRAHQDNYMKNLAMYCATIDSLVKIMEHDRLIFETAKVACSELQVEFVEWLGFDVVVTFCRAEDLTPKMLEDIISRSKAQHVTLVIDNLQSGPDAGLTIAQEIGVRHVVLTNFPLKGYYPTALMDNYTALLQAVK